MSGYAVWVSEIFLRTPLRGTARTESDLSCLIGMLIPLNAAPSRYVFNSHILRQNPIDLT
jgi:hypothetical protein